MTGLRPYYKTPSLSSALPHRSTNHQHNFNMEGEEVEVPSYFLCPISLQIMRDPVTLLTGITFDRESIEQWIFSSKQHTCPVTKQPLTDCAELTPNHTLRRLIQAWCAANAAHGVERLPTPRPPVDRAQVAALLDEARAPNSRLAALHKLKKIVSESERNRRCVEAATGAVDLLAMIISAEGNESVIAGDEALTILYSLGISEQRLLSLMKQNEDFLDSLTAIMRRTSNYQSRTHALLLIKSLVVVVPPARLMNLGREFYEEIVKILSDRISYQAMKAALQVLHGVCPWGRNAVKIVRAGAVSVILELLLDETEKRACEMMMVVLEELCGCADGRAEVVGHAAGIAVVSKKMTRVSPVATERAVRVLYSISLHAPRPAVLDEMLEVGAVSKLCLLLQAECGRSTRGMVKEILRIHSRVWRSSPCILPRLKALYPSS